MALPAEIKALMSSGRSTQWVCFASMCSKFGASVASRAADASMSVSARLAGSKSCIVWTSWPVGSGNASKADW